MNANANANADAVLRIIRDWWSRYPKLREYYAGCFAYGSLVARGATRFDPPESDIELTAVFSASIDTLEKRSKAINVLKEYMGHLEHDLQKVYVDFPRDKSLVCITPISSFDLNNALHKDRKATFWDIAEFVPITEESHEAAEIFEAVRENVVYRFQNESLISVIEDVQRFRANFLRTSRDGTSDHLHADYRSCEARALSKNLSRVASILAAKTKKNKDLSGDIPYGETYIVQSLAEMANKSKFLESLYNDCSAATTMRIGIPLSREVILNLWEYLYDSTVLCLSDSLDIAANSSEPGEDDSLGGGGSGSASDELKVFEDELPVVGRSEVEEAEKAILYGGRPKDLSIGFSAFEHAVAKNSFDRELAAELCEEIRVLSPSARSYTVRSIHGAGLSITLAQIVRDLSSDYSIKVFWVVADQDQTRATLASLTEETADKYYSQAKTQLPQVEHIVFVIDDVSEVEPALIRNLLRFRERLKYLVSVTSGPRVTLVFGSFGAIGTCSEDETFELKLTKKDRDSCYEKMASHYPKIIEGVTGGIEAILTAHPEGRWFRNDSQAFIDFLLEHGCPTVVAVNHWLARTNGLGEDDCDMFTTIAASQLVGLSVEQSVAKKTFAPYFTSGLDDVEQVVRRVPGLTLTHGEWRGVGLSCARRAQSILKRTGRYSFDYLRVTYSELIGAALDCSAAAELTRTEPLEYARHIFQRLSKDPLYRFEGKPRLSWELLGEHISSLRRGAERWGYFQKAKWAGTLSAVLKRPGMTEESSDLSLSELYAFICGLCESARQQLTDLNDVTAQSVLVSLYRANRMMLKHVGEVESECVQKASLGLLYAYTTEDLCGVVDNVLSSGSADREHRANELVHVRCQFEDAANRKKDRRYFESMTHFLSEIEEIFRRNACELDAGNWLKRAEYVRIDPRSGQATRAKSLAEKTKLIIAAKDCVRKHPMNQGTWERKIAIVVDRLVKDFPEIDTLLEASEFERLTS